MFIFLFTRMTTWLQMCARDSRHARNASPTHFFISILFLDPFLLSVFLFLFCFLLLRIDDAQWGIRTDCIQIWSVEPNFVIRKKTPPSVKSKLPHIYGKFRSNILKRKREREKMQMLEKKKESSQLSKFVHFQREEKVRTFLMKRDSLRFRLAENNVSRYNQDMQFARGPVMKTNDDNAQPSIALIIS